jgi:hypothetical protein
LSSRTPRVGLLDRASGLVDEARLNVQPPRPEGLGWTGCKKSGVLLSSFVCAGLAGSSAALRGSETGARGVGPAGPVRGAAAWHELRGPHLQQTLAELVTCDNIVGRPEVDGQPSADDRWPGRGATATPGGLLLEV